MVKLISPAPFGWANLPFGSTQRPYSIFNRHRGKDWGWYIADPAKSRRVVAPVDGEIIAAYDGFTTGKTQNGGWGNYIAIRVNSRVVWRGSHFPKGWRGGRRIGQRVTAGTYISQMGDSGDTGGQVHLHEELWIDGVRVDPDLYRGPNGKHLPGTEVVGSPAGAEAFNRTQVAVSALNVRSARSTNSSILRTLKVGQTVKTGRTVGNWEHVRFKVGLKTVTGWAHKDFLTLRFRKVTAVSLNIRSSASMNGRILGSLKRGVKVTVYASSNGRDDAAWIKVRGKSGSKTLTGWVARKYTA